jgi:hypothetical protein
MGVGWCGDRRSFFWWEMALALVGVFVGTCVGRFEHCQLRVEVFVKERIMGSLFMR